MPNQPARRRLLAAGAAFAAAAVLSGCGFHLRGPRPLAFATMHVSVNQYSDFGAALRRQITATGSTIVTEDASAADARLQILTNERGREILSLTGAGKVREYQLTQRIRFRLIDRKNAELLPLTEISAQREYTFNDAEVLGKEQEEALLYRDMQSDLIQQIMRRIAAYRPQQ